MAMTENVMDKTTYLKARKPKQEERTESQNFLSGQAPIT